MKIFKRATVALGIEELTSQSAIPLAQPACVIYITRNAKTESITARQIRDTKKSWRPSGPSGQLSGQGWGTKVIARFRPRPQPSSQPFSLSELTAPLKLKLELPLRVERMIRLNASVDS